MADVALSAEANIRARGYAAGTVVESYLGHSKLVTQPASRIKDAGTTTHFQVVASGTEPLSYQWFKDAVPLADHGNVTGATSAILTLSGVIKADEGAYQVVVSNLFGSVTSIEATLTVMDPAILVPPLGTNRAVGESVTLSVTAGGTPPLTYQWYQDGLPVPRATGPELFINSLTNADAGSYTVQVSNVHGAVTSSPAPLTVVLVTADTEFQAARGALYVAVQPDGKLVVGTPAWMHRLNPDGTLDTFDPRLGLELYCMALQPDGKILAGGQPNGIVRVNPDGTPDSTFNPETFSYVDALVLQADGRILAGGHMAGQPGYGTSRLNPDGTLDATFNPGTNASTLPLAVQPDGKILVCGLLTRTDGSSRHYFVRLHPDGNLDPGFEVNTSDEVEEFALQRDGKILIGGDFWSVDGIPRLGLARLNADGGLDAGFAPAGDYESVLALATDGNGNVLVGLSEDNSIGRLVQLDSNGVLDRDFNPNVNQSVSDIVIQGDGKILIAGRFTSVHGHPAGYLARLLGRPENEVSLCCFDLLEGRPGFNIISATPRSVVVEVSTNLVNWGVIETIPVGNDPVRFSDTDDPNVAARFYRVSWQP